MTPLDIIKNARNLLNIDGLGMTVSAEEAKTGFSFLNMIISNWNIQGLVPYYNLTETFSITSSTYIYLVGAGQTINTTRPVKIVSVLIRDTENTDHQCKIIENEQYWKEIVSKQSTSYYPEYVLYTPTYPYGELRFYPVPDQNLTLVLTQKVQLGAFSSMSEVISLPPGYELALVYNLAVKIAPQYGIPVNTGDTIFDEAARLLSDIKRQNMTPLFLKPEPFLLQNGRYDIYSE